MNKRVLFNLSAPAIIATFVILLRGIPAQNIAIPWIGVTLGVWLSFGISMENTWVQWALVIAILLSIFGSAILGAVGVL